MQPLRPAAFRLRGVGWVMLFLGLAIPPFVGWFVAGRRHGDLALTLLALASLPILIWTASLGAKIGPCSVGSCMSSGQHSHLVIGIAALAIVAIALVLLALQQPIAGGIALVVGLILGAFSLTRTDTPSIIMLLILAAGALAYVLTALRPTEEPTRVPDYPPAA